MAGLLKSSFPGLGQDLGWSDSAGGSTLDDKKLGPRAAACADGIWTFAFGASQTHTEIIAVLGAGNATRAEQLADAAFGARRPGAGRKGRLGLLVGLSHHVVAGDLPDGDATTACARSLPGAAGTGRRRYCRTGLMIVRNRRSTRHSRPEREFA